MPYTTPLAKSLPSNWALAEVLLSSSYEQWGTSSLQKDVSELSKCVSYFRALKTGKIVIMGHSTGCQDVMEYLTGPGASEREKIDGGIIQASVSDREALASFDDKLAEKSEFAQKWVDEGKAEDILPSQFSIGLFGNTPVTARRFLSLASPNHDGDDDYFSTDLSDEQLAKSFGALPKGSPLCILYSGEDQYVAKEVDKKALVEKWIGFVKRGDGTVDEVNSGVVNGATHNLTDCNEEVVKDLIGRVARFVESVEKGL